MKPISINKVIVLKTNKLGALFKNDIICFTYDIILPAIEEKLNFVSGNTFVTMNTRKKTTNTIYIVLILILELSFSATYAQYSLVGDATQVNTTTYQLTKDSLWQNGSVWNNTKYDLNQSFEVYFELYFGDVEKGADGITFTLQQQGTNAGSAGQGLGAGGVKPSVIIEYDTFENSPYDPTQDHIAIEQNGDVNHNTANKLAGPIYATTDSLNIEDGKWHNSRVKWDAPSKTFEVYFDCILRLTYTGDIINNIFGGNPNVYYGFTAATGGSHNDQLVRGFSFVSPSQKFDVAICIGDTFKLDFSDKDIRTWKPAAKINATSPSHPLFFPTVFTQYISDVTRCTMSWEDTVNITVNNLPVVNLGPDKTMCSNEPALTFDAGNAGSTYLWSSTETSQTISKSSSGTYIVKVSDNKQCSAKDTVVLTVNPAPVINLGNDTTNCFKNTAWKDSIANTFTSILWSTGAITNTASLNHSDSLKVTVTNQFLCSATAVKYIGEKCNPSITLCFPDVFTPNNDGFNDDFRPCGEEGEKKTEINTGNYTFYSDNILAMNFMVYDRWGIKMFEYTDKGIPVWNGYFKNVPASSGTYFWIAHYTDSSNSQYEKTGYVTLLK